MWLLPVELLPHEGSLTKVLWQRPKEFISWRWTQKHQQWAQAKTNDSASQARWEALALTLAIWTWRDIVLKVGGPWRFLGDAKGVMQGAAKFKAKDPAINRLFMEIALIVVEAGHELHEEHLWSEDNFLADQVSRLQEGAVLPEQLRGVHQARMEEPKWQIIPALM